MELTVRTSTISGAHVLSLGGEIDLATVPRLHDAINRATTAASGGTVVIDLDGVYACDDSGLGVLLGVAGRARASGGDLLVVCSPGALRDRLARTGFDRAVSVAASVAEAIGIAATSPN